ncbi:MAG: CDP-diacylglycerol--serine O-phosphatidyltransferase [Proteobacteria bacterium]|nr:CDP-diacylglycerol--serine O-phosphatidyltransferase [Pseudomonadota bacterium]
MAPKSSGKKSRIYWLPNVITTCGLFSGFYAIVQAMNMRFDLAAIAIFVALTFDVLDGRVARITRTESDFGAEYDSLSDMVAFGAAPALIIYEWGLRGMDKFGWFAAFVYCGCAALRLARFNTARPSSDKFFFRGLPSPAAAGLLAGFVWTVEVYNFHLANLEWLTWALTVFAGASMVSNIPYYSGKDINIRKAVPFWVIVLSGFVIIISFQITENIPEVLFVFFAVYAVSGYIRFLVAGAGLKDRDKNSVQKSQENSD